jgi:GH15 family glucan-1,4-alpha-glucosidase
LAAGARRIEDYALIGDCETAALVGRDGSIDWLCWPRFDSDACFAALLGTPEHGRWRIAPAEGSFRTSRSYRDDTLILETRFEDGDGNVATLIDFMRLRNSHSSLVRLVRGERGRVAMCMDLVLRFGYGAVVPWVTRLGARNGTALRAIAGPDMAILRTGIEVRGEGLTTVGEFTAAAGETVAFVLTHAPSHLPVPEPFDPLAALAETEAFWRSWSTRCDRDLPGAGDDGPRWSAAVMRSLVTLKALTFAPTGGIVAAATTSLPEVIGGPRNWDYRFCWLRDATLTLLALMNAGYFDEAKAWRDWLLRAAAGSPDQTQIMYGLAGERRLTEWEVDWLPGFLGSRPVRIGNAAHGQLQLDVYGEVMDALYQARRCGLPENAAAWALQRALLVRLEALWQEPDQGMWEIRGPPRHFTYSKVMAWLAFDRAVLTAQTFGLEGPVERWRELRSRIHADVCAKGYDPAAGSFVQAYGSSELDASLLLLPAVGFLPASDSRIAGTVAAIERRLVRNGLVIRYDTGRTDDGLPAGEGAFLACSFWLADAYVMLGRADDARALFNRLLGLCNDVGLLSEEFDVGAARQLGNTPQAFSHVGLINTAHNLSRAAKPVEQRSEQPRGTTPREGGRARRESPPGAG